MEISRIYSGGVLCDGVGLGKTYVGLMLIERLVVREGKRVALLAPKSAMEDVWEPSIEKSLPHLNSGFVSLIKYNHTDLQRRDEKAGRDMELTLRDADVILIDEAHHFRNPGVAGTGATQESRYRRFQRFLHQEGARAKQFFFLNATPINNSINDFRHILELVTNKDQGFFAKDTRSLGIQNLRSHFVQLEKRVSSAAATSANEAGELTALHLLESPKLDQPMSTFIGDSREVIKVGWGNNTVWLDAGGKKAETRPGTSGFQAGLTHLNGCRGDGGGRHYPSRRTFCGLWCVRPSLASLLN